LGIIEHHKKLAAPDPAHQVNGIARPDRQAQPQHIKGRAQIFDFQAGLVAQGGMAAVGGDGQPGLDLHITLRAIGQDSADAITLCDQILGLGFHQKMKVGQLLCFCRQEIQKVPLRHQGDEFAGRGQAGEIADREMVVAKIQAGGSDRGIWQLEEVLQQPQLMHDLKGRGVHRVAAEIAQEVPVLFQNRHIHPGAGQKKAAHHAGRAAARDHACGRNRIHPCSPPCPCRLLV